MAKVVVLGAGISGHTAISYLSKYLKKDHEVIMVSPNSNFQWVPSNIWVGVGLMTPDQVKFKLAPVYKKMGVNTFSRVFLRLHELIRLFVEMEKWIAHIDPQKPFYNKHEKKRQHHKKPGRCMGKFTECEQVKGHEKNFNKKTHKKNRSRQNGERKKPVFENGEIEYRSP